MMRAQHDAPIDVADVSLRRGMHMVFNSRFHLVEFSSVKSSHSSSPGSDSHSTGTSLKFPCAELSSAAPRWRETLANQSRLLAEVKRFSILGDAGPGIETFR